MSSRRPVKRLGTTIATTLVLICGNYILSGCSGAQEKTPSVIVIAVDGLASYLIPCRDDEASTGAGGFSLLCHESIRFDNAFTPSVLSESSLASLFTGLYPFEHGLRDNSAHSFISAKYDTVAQAALRLGFRTAFFSGGPPIWRSSGLNHGFELFEDNLNLSSANLYRPMRQSTDLFLNWLQHEVHQDPFFSVIYAPDLRFPSVVTHNVEGTSRAAGTMGQLEAIEESIDLLVAKLQNLHRWDSTLVIVVGLNGLPLKDADPAGVDLSDNNVKVALFIKPPQNPQNLHDVSLPWSVDQNVSLVDVGRTLKEEVGERTHPVPIFPTVSLIKEFHNKTENHQSEIHEAERPILIESGWPAWRGYGGIRYAVRKNFFYYFADGTVRIYNALLDPSFTNPLAVDGPVSQQLGQEIEPLISQIGNQNRFQSIPLIDRQKFEVARLLWGSAGRLNVVSPAKSGGLARLDELRVRYPNDMDFVAWRARFALEQNDWNTLLELGKKYDIPRWTFTAERAKKKNAKSHGWNEFLKQDPCWRTIFNSIGKPVPAATCENESALRFLAMIQAVLPADAERARDLFVRDFAKERLDLQIAIANYMNGLIWDTRLSVLNQISDMELILKLPEFRVQAESVRKRMVELKL